jgi:hypothetical protein
MPLLEVILVRLVGIHRRFITHCYRRGHSAAATRFFCMLRSPQPPVSAWRPLSALQAGVVLTSDI